jgi:hypothetical protein
MDRKGYFGYFAVSLDDPEFVRTYNEYEAIEKLDNFIEMIR